MVRNFWGSRMSGVYGWSMDVRGQGLVVFRVVRDF